MRIVIDMQGAQTESRFRGIGRYSLGFVQAMLRNKGSHEIILVLNGSFSNTIEPIRAAFVGVIPQEKILVWHIPGPVCEIDSDNHQRRKIAELIREAFISSLSPDVVHITSLFEGYADNAVTSIGLFDKTTPVSVSFYDLIPLLSPNDYLEKAPRYKNHYAEKLEHLKKASLLLSISESTRLEGIEHLKISRENIVNVSTAIEPYFKKQELDAGQKKAILENLGITSNFILYTGGADARKNLERLLHAFSSLPQNVLLDHQLVIAGKIPDSVVRTLRSLSHSLSIPEHNLRITGYISDSDLIALYNLCKVFVFPSWHEGFGLPALEAMACGAPVIGSNTSSVAEVIGLPEAMFDPLDISDMSSKILQSLTDLSFRQTLTMQGSAQAAKFSWDTSAQTAISALEMLYRKKPHQTKFDDASLTNLLDSIAEIFTDDMPEDLTLGIADNISKFTFRKTEKQIFVDISELVHRDARTGIQRVTRNILRELLNSPPNGYTVKPVYGSLESGGYRYANNFITSLEKRELANGKDELIEYRAGDIFLGLDLQHHVVCFQREYLNKLRQEGVKVAFVVYDLLPILQPATFPEGAAHGHEEWIRTVAQFDAALCISRSVALELKQWLCDNGPQRLRPLQIDWFHLGADISNSDPTTGIPDDAASILNKLRAEPSFLMVGTIEPRKGHAQVLAAFEEIWAKNEQINLVIVGKPGWLVEPLLEKLKTHPLLGTHLFWMDGISDQYLEQIYAAASCLIAASFGEGFGLPLIEAAQHRLSLIVRDIPIFREVAGEHAYYFQESDAASLAKSILDWLSLYNSNTHPSSNALKWLTWSESAKILIKRLINTPKTDQS